METINLNSYVKTDTTGSKSSSGKNDSAYTLLGGKGRPVSEVLGLQRLYAVQEDKAVFLSPSNISSVPVEILEKVAGGAKADFQLKKAEGSQIENILFLFGPNTGPKTKSHDYGFFMKPDGSYIFFSLQGTSIKEILL